MSGSTIHIVCTCDEKFAMPMGVMIYSVLRNLTASKPVNFFIIDGGITSPSKTRLESLVGATDPLASITWINPPVSILNEQWTLTDGQSVVSLVRLFLTDLLPGYLDKVIYLDCDMLVKASIHRLWEYEIGDKAVLAVRDLGIPTLSHQRGVQVYRQLKLNPDIPYFNAGLMVINLAKWRTDNIGEQTAQFLVDFAEEHRFNDQEALNAVIRGDVGWLPLQWNQQTIVFRKDPSEEPFEWLSAQSHALLKEDPFLIHFTEKPNPWNGRCTHPYRSLFLQYLKESGWLTSFERIPYLTTYNIAMIYQQLCDVTRPVRHSLVRLFERDEFKGDETRCGSVYT